MLLHCFPRVSLSIHTHVPPPTICPPTHRCAFEGGSGSPIATGDGVRASVWAVGGDTTMKLSAFDGDTGALQFRGDNVGDVAHFHTPIVAGGGRTLYYAFTGGVAKFSITS